VNYSTPEAAATAIAQLNGIEFPPHSNQRLKVMYAEQLGARNNGPGSASQHSHHSGHAGHQVAVAPGARSPMAMSQLGSSPSPVHTPLSPGVNLSPEVNVASVQETLANMSLPRVASANGVEELEAARRMASPISSGRAANARVTVVLEGPVTAREGKGGMLIGEVVDGNAII
jgi:hypothetical protein